MNIVIYLVRHGHTLSNSMKIYAGWSSENLSEKGIWQAKRLGSLMKDVGVDSVHYSPIERAFHTAKIINRYVNGDLIEEPDLREMKLGPWEGLSEGEVENQYPSAYQTWLKRPAELRMTGRETLAEVQQRALRVINRLLASLWSKTFLIVTHVAIIRCLLIYFRRLHLNSYKSISVPNTYTHQIVFKDRVLSEEIAVYDGARMMGDYRF